MNYVDEEQMDVMAFEMGQTRLRGSRFADKVEDVGRGVVSHFQEASKDQEGWYDDALRLAGGGLKNVAWLAERPGIKQGLQVLGSGGWAGGKLGEAAAQRLGIDPRLGKWTGGLAGDIATGGVLKKGAQIAKTTKQLSRLSPLESGRLVTGGGFGAAPVGPRTKLGKIKAAATMDKGTREAVEQAAKQTQKSPLMIPEDQIQTLARKNLDQPPNVKLAQKIPKDDFPFLSEQLQKEVNLRNRSIDTQQGGMQRILDRIKGIEEGAPDPLFKRKDGRPRTKSQVLNHLKTKGKEYKRRLVDLKVRDLEHPKRTFTAEIAKGLDRHHLAGLKWSEPFFDGLNATDAQELRRFASKQNVFFGDDIRNRIDLPKNIHVNEPELNIHTWLNYVGGSHKKINLKGTSLDVRKAEMAKMIDMVKRSQIRLVELGYLDPRLTAGVSKKLQKGLKGLDPIQDLPMINMSKVDLQQDMLFQSIDKQLLDLRSKGF